MNDEQQQQQQTRRERERGNRRLPESIWVDRGVHARTNKLPPLECLYVPCVCCLSLKLSFFPVLFLCYVFYLLRPCTQKTKERERECRERLNERRKKSTRHRVCVWMDGRKRRKKKGEAPEGNIIRISRFLLL